MEKNVMNRIILLSFILIILLLHNHAFSQERGEGPMEMFISYQADPVDRPALRQYLKTDGVEQLEAWKQDGVFDSYLLLFSSYVDKDTWDVLLVLQFGEYVQTERWKEIEKTRPGGLSVDGLNLARPLNTYLADVTWQGEMQDSGHDPSKSVYFVIPYDYTGRGTYRRYFEVYVKPQLDGWIDEGNLASYRIYLNQHPTGKPWDVYFLLEYKDIQAFALRDEVKWKVRREQLQDLPDWRLISDTKWDYRTENETIIADPIMLDQ